MKDPNKMYNKVEAKSSMKRYLILVICSLPILLLLNFTLFVKMSSFLMVFLDVVVCFAVVFIGNYIWNAISKKRKEKREAQRKARELAEKNARNAESVKNHTSQSKKKGKPRNRNKNKSNTISDETDLVANTESVITNDEVTTIASAKKIDSNHTLSDENIIISTPTSNIVKIDEEKKDVDINKSDDIIETNGVDSNINHSNAEISTTTKNNSNN